MPTSAHAKGHHRKTRRPGLDPAMNAERVTTAEQHRDGDGVGDAQRQFGVADEDEGDHDREGRKETQQAKTQRSGPVAPRQLRTLAAQATAAPFAASTPVAPADKTDTNCGGNASAMTALRGLGIRGLPNGAQSQDLPPAFIDASQQVKTAVNDAPGQVAAERTDQHRLNLDVARRGNTEAADEGESHDQAEQGLRDPFHRIQHTPISDISETSDIESNARWLNLQGKFAGYFSSDRQQETVETRGAGHGADGGQLSAGNMQEI